MHRLPVPGESPSADFIAGAAAGAAGGLVAAWAMERFQVLFSRARGDDADAAQRATGREIEWTARTQDQLSGETGPATVRTAEALAGTPLEPRERAVAGPLFHYAFGAGVGAVYGALAERQPDVVRGFGIPFGLAVWAAADEAGVPALGLTRSPAERPASAHVYSFLSHVVYGAATEAVRRLLRGTPR